MKVQKFHSKMMKIFFKIFNLNMNKIKDSNNKMYNKINIKILKIIHFNKKILILMNKM